MEDRILKIGESISNLKDKKNKIYFFVQDTKGNAKASIRYIYQMANALLKEGYNPIILHEKPDYFGVSSWLGEQYSKIPHQSVEGQNLQIAPEDFIIVPEIFGYVMAQLANVKCTKIVLSQSYDQIFETLQPGQMWSQFGFTKCITTSEIQKKYISQYMRNVPTDIIEPVISEVFEKSKYPAKPIIAISSREQRDSINLIKSFYQKYPQFRWITFRDMRGISEEEFANTLKECMLSVWDDRTSAFGTFPLESMKCGVPVIGVVPKMVPEWMNEDNGIWIQDELNLVNFIGEYIQNWLEDNISEDIYNGMEKSSLQYSNMTDFENKIISLFNEYTKSKLNVFETEYNKLQPIEQ
jgi:glycosyltransferase involved in cell wall biosynthesis